MDYWKQFRWSCEQAIRDVGGDCGRLEKSQGTIDGMIKTMWGTVPPRRNIPAQRGELATMGALDLSLPVFSCEVGSVAVTVWVS